MKIKELINSIFSYKPETEYNFNIEDDKNTSSEENTLENNATKPQDIYPSLQVNLDYVKTRLNILINSDIVVREFIINARGKQYSAFLLYIDGLVDSQSMNDFILSPLMMRNKNNTFEGDQNRIIAEAITNNITVRKVKKFNIAEYIISCLLPQNAIKQTSKFNDLIQGVNAGNCALFIDTLNVAFDIEVKGFKQRSVEKPNNEVIIKGPQEAFVEGIRVNTSLIRKIVNNENLIIENIEVGKVTKTKCAVCYIQNITNPNLVAEVKYRINNLEIDSLLSSCQLEQLIVEENFLGIPEVLSTERPDKTTKYLLGGRVVVLVNGTPYALIMPATLIDFMTSSEDTNLKVSYSNFLRCLRLFAAFLTLLLPGLYVAITSFHQEILPTSLLYSILASRENVPFPIIIEIFIMEIAFELIREAGLRIPSSVGPTIGIVSALILGQAAVSAGIVSPILIIIVAITGISSFSIPDFSFGFHLRYLRFVFILLGFMSGFLGIALGLFVYLSFLCSLQSFGIPYLVPFAPLVDSKGNAYLLKPIWKREYRANYLSPKRPKDQDKISMKWKYLDERNDK